MQIDSFSSVEATRIEWDGHVLTVRFDGNFGQPPNYWRSEDPEDSIVEVGTDPSSGTVSEIAVVSLPSLSEHSILPMQIFEGIPAGLPRASLALWSDGRSYVREERGVVASLVGDRLTVAFGELDQRPANSVECNSVVFLIDESNILRGFVIKNLSDRAVQGLSRPKVRGVYRDGQFFPE